MLAGLPMRGDFEQSIEILALEAQDADGIDVAKFALAHDKGGARDLMG